MKFDLSKVRWQEPRRLADPHDPYWDVVPIPFYPNDLPDIHWEYLTRSQRIIVHVEQMRILFPVAAA